MNAALEMAATLPEGRLSRLALPDRPSRLRGCSLADLGSELLSRIADGELAATEDSILLGCEIEDALQLALDVHRNRRSRQHYSDLFSNFCEWEESVREIVKGATIVELGCGSINPYGLLFLFLLVGAKRAIGIDLDEAQSPRRAVKCLAELAGMLLVDPSSVVGTFPISRDKILRNVGKFDLARLRNGDPSGIDGDRLVYKQESVHSMSLGDGEADIVISTAFLEHIASVDDAMREMARTMRPGAIGVHIIDGCDHYRYADPTHHPLEFLTEATDAEMVHGSNRIRPVMFGPIFERHGFEVLTMVPFETAKLTSELKARLVAPFCTMSDEALSIVGAKFVTRCVMGTARAST